MMLRRFLMFGGAWFQLLLLGASCLAQSAATTSAPQENASEKPGPEAAVRAAIEAYVAAFNAGDAQALAECWSDDGVFLTPDGSRQRGKERIEAYFASYFEENPGLHLVVTVDALRLIGDDVALEEGTAYVEHEGEASSESRYLAIHRRGENGWKLDTIRETVLPEAESPDSPLNDLAWLVGSWEDVAPEGVAVESTYHWAEGGKFLVHTFSVLVEGELDMKGTQIIGWDPSEQRIRSWFFDSDGGFGTGTWTAGETDGVWTVEQKTTLPDGRHGTAVNHYLRIDDDTFMWSSSERQIDGAADDDVAPFAVRRVLTSE